jgi:hypothetical protein
MERGISKKETAKWKQDIENRNAEFAPVKYAPVKYPKGFLLRRISPQYHLPELP